MAMKDMLPSLPPDKASLAKWCFIAIYAVKSISVAPWLQAVLVLFILIVALRSS
jgi:hypothetical protein